MEPQLFQRFAALAYEKAGISIKPGKEALVAARVAKRLRALAIPDAEGYLRYLEEDSSGEELVRFLDVISTHFTSFFREPDHFDLLREELTELLLAGQRRLRLWSAACSTGEEPYSMAMTALGLDGVAGADLKILATDISVDTLRQATEGRYGTPRLEPVPEGLRRRWFKRHPDPRDPDGELWEAGPELKARVVYRRLNLAEPPFPMNGPLDVVFCRNVLIYFDHPTRQRLISAVEKLLRPGGLLCIGHTETLSGIDTRLKMQRPSVFRRPTERAS
ncbi:CheR family methyltransferase [Anaeromyxobacter diazotrophicus]|uniref:protein-glutamate O-methyltransferase n=1 Tax=Anaeromyxobacter diazotrophicus TaxID=2590199 RepID=A0A7I9VS14_9BACT|nr:CheR family methyltransferase [Anaeromyxobacter diazotrophicus]GEJ59223.1 chemotaxis protein methyltransferase [Anaeromyxobacter diazotrophicus]